MEKNKSPISSLPPSSWFSDDKSGAEIAYRIKWATKTGEKFPPLVFLHGFNGSSKSWAYQFSEFNEHIIVAIDAPGFGGSKTLESDMSRIADCTASLIKSLVDEKVVVVGHSMGGMQAQVLAANHSNIFAGLVLSCTHKGRAQGIDVPLDAEILERIKQREEMDDLTYGELRIKKMLKGPIAPDVFSFLAAVAGEVTVDGIRAGGLAMHHLDTTNLLSRISVPVMNLTAARDIVVAPDAAAALKNGLPISYDIHLSNVGHAPYCEDYQSFNAAIKQFLLKI